MWNRATIAQRATRAVESRSRLDVVLVRSNGEKERTTEKRVSLYRIFAQAKGAAGAGGGAATKYA